jgi:hypothetical protein
METRWKDPVILAYAAGFLDGEGFIGISRSVPKPEWHNRARTTRYEPSVVIVNTSHSVLMWFHETFGGNLASRTSQKAGATGPRKDQWKWTVGNRMAADFLKAVAPYLKVKQRQAELVVAFVETKTPTVKKPRYLQVTPEELAWREDMFQQLVALNDSWYMRRRRLQRLSEGTPSPTEGSETGEAIVRTPSKGGDVSGTETTHGC